MSGWSWQQMWFPSKANRNDLIDQGHTHTEYVCTVWRGRGEAGGGRPVWVGSQECRSVSIQDEAGGAVSSLLLNSDSQFSSSSSSCVHSGHETRGRRSPDGVSDGRWSSVLVQTYTTRESRAADTTHLNWQWTSTFMLYLNTAEQINSSSLTSDFVSLLLFVLSQSIHLFYFKFTSSCFFFFYRL